MKKTNYQQMKNEVINITPNGIIKFFASPYVAGYSLQSAVDCAHLFLKRGVYTTVDVLGESAKSPEAAVKFKDLYLKTIKTFSDNFTDKNTITSVSLKPSSMVYAVEDNGKIHIDRETCEAHIEEICKMAKTHGLDVTIDMEDHYWTEVTLQMHKSLRDKGFDNVGTVLQSMLYRTDEDIDNLPENSRIRICTGGVYAEPETIAHQSKLVMKDYLVKYSKKLLDNGAYLEIATHDENIIERIFKEYIIPKEIPPDRFEIQWLMGVPKEKLSEELLTGKYLNYGKPVKVRLYVPFAEDEKDAIKYSKRRLVSNPEIIKYGLITFLRSSKN